MAEGLWAAWQVKSIATGFSQKRPKQDWFEDPHHYQTSLKSWAHLVARQLYTMELEERQLIMFMYHIGVEFSGVQTFDPNDISALPSDYMPQNRAADE